MNRDHDVSTEGIIAQISRIRESANTLIETELRKRSLKGIVPAHGSALRFLFQQNKSVPIKAVVENVRRVKSTVTVMMNTLERHGYIRKLTCEDDKRIILVELTQKGQQIRKDFQEISAVLLKQVYGTMKESKRRQLVKLLKEVEENISQ